MTDPDPTAETARLHAFTLRLAERLCLASEVLGRLAEKKTKKGKTMPLYSVGTWDTDAQAYTPQEGLTVPSQNVPRVGLFEVLRQLRGMGYSAHRRRDARGNHDHNDSYVLVERTDGKPMDGRR